MTALARISHHISTADWEGVPTESSGALAAEVYDDLRAIEALWRRFETKAVFTPYQHFDWIEAYRDGLAQAEGFETRIVVITDPAKRVRMLLPLAVSRGRGFAVASLIGGKQANFHFPLMAADQPSPSPESVWSILREVAATTLKIDAYRLFNQPLSWNGQPNPLAEGGRPSPSNGYRLTLDEDCETTLARAFGRETRKKLRKKERRLLERGPLTHLVARNSDEVDTILAAFYAQKGERFRERGINDPFAPSSVQAFIRAGCLAGLAEGAPAIELHALLVGERILATFGGAADSGRFCGMFNSFDQEPEIARYSPGEVLVYRIIEAQCRRGRRLFDLGVGEASYKSLCDETEELVDLVVPVTLRGRLYAGAIGFATDAKRRIKRTPWAFRFASALRGAKAKLPA